MLIFFSIALLGLILLIGGSILGHDHDHDVLGDHDHDADHGKDEPTVSIFSTKVIGMFIMGFGAGGCVTRYYSPDTMLASLIGVGTGVCLGALMYLVLKVIYKQQSNSVVTMTSLVGRFGIVTVGAGRGESGEVEIGSNKYLAEDVSGNPMPRGGAVEVISAHGRFLVVKRVGS